MADIFDKVKTFANSDTEKKQAPRLCSIGIKKIKIGKLRKTLNSHLGNSAVSYGSSLALNKLII